MDNVKKVLKFYLSHIMKFKKDFFLSELTMVIGASFVNNAPPLVIAAVLNKLVKGQYDKIHPFNSFIGYILIYALLAIVLMRLVWYIFDYYYWRLEARVITSAINQIFEYYLNQTADFHSNQFSGSLVSNANKIAGSYPRIADTFNFSILQMATTLIFVNFVMVGRSLVYTIVLDMIAAIYITSSVYVTKPLRVENAKFANLESQQTGLLSDAVSNILVIKSFASSFYEKKRFKKATNQTSDQLNKVFRKFSYQMNVFTVVTGFLEVGALICAIVSVIYFKSNIATAFLIFNYTGTIILQLFNFSNNAMRGLNRAFGDASEMVNILEEKPKIIDPASPEKVRIKKGEVNFNNVKFTHDGSNDSIFKNFNLKISDGEKVGLVGHSGAGKTTLVRILMRFSDIDNGEVSIDGQNIAKIKQDDLHNKISYVPQEPLLFHRSILENITYGDPDANEQAIKKVVLDAHIDFIDDLPLGINTMVGERGVKLSGGQRQRVAIARAMLKQAPVLILDEATSALDSKSESLIQDALWKLMEGKTTIVIAHRLSTIMKMDRIIVLDKGKIVEDGNHSELIKKGGIYADLWEHQSGGFLE